MTDGGGAKTALRERLIWLRTLGVEEIAADDAAPIEGGRQAGEGQNDRSPERQAAAAREVDTAVQPGLFGLEAQGEGSAAAPDESRHGRRPAGRAPVSPIASAVAPDAPDAAARLARIAEDLGDCRRCRLHEKRTNIVFGVGDPGARLMFIGEGPGADEDRRGEPFVGRAGQLLTRIIEAMGLRRDQVYIANVVKCRPPDNRTPLPDEVATCSPFLFQQIAAIRPRVIVCLGTPAAQTVLATRETITRMRGSFREVDGIRIMPTFHPAYLLRNPAAKREVWEDMKLVMDYLKSEA